MKMKKIILIIAMVIIAPLVFPADKTGKIEIKCDRGCEIFYDGGLLSTTIIDNQLVALDQIPCGEHKIRVVKDSVDLANVTFVLKIDQIFSLDLSRNIRNEPPEPIGDFANDVMPEMVKYTDPYYPPELKNEKKTGVVWVKALINDKGKIIKSLVAKSSGSLSFDRSAMKAAYLNQYKPAIKNGIPIPIWISYKVEFTLKN